MCFYFIRIYFYVDAVDAAPEENQASLKRVVGRKKTSAHQRFHLSLAFNVARSA